MAANLNRPADFVRIPENLSGLELIPPSQFEKPAAHRKSELEKARLKIEQLVAENEKLKTLKLSQKESYQQVPIYQNDYADELIKRQVGEVADLKAELLKNRQTYEEKILILEKKCSALEEESERKIKLTETQKRIVEQEFEQKFSQLNEKLQSALQEAQREGAALREKFETSRSALIGRVTELEEQLKTVESQAQEQQRELERELRAKSETVESQSQQLQQLRTYITDKEQTYKPAQVWKSEKEAADNKLQLAQAENKKLESELELMNVRFKSLSDILAVQEEELSQGKSAGIGKKKIHDLLITKWRQKVYALMVQQKSAEIVNNNDFNNLNQKMKCLEEQLSSRCSEVKVLEHSLQEKTAQLQLEINRGKHLSQELEQTHQVAVKLDDQSRESGVYLSELRHVVSSQAEQNEKLMAKLEEKSVLLKTLSQRVGFAAGRMEVLKAQMMRKVAFTDSIHDSSKDISKKSMSISRPDDEFSRDSEDHLCQELERLMRERDSLATQMREDTSKWTNKLTQTRTQYETEITTLRKSVQELTATVAKKSKTCAELATDLATIQEEVKEKDDTISQLQAELDRYARGMDSVLTDQKVKDETEFSKRLADVEKKLNESKREHAKTVVSLRQMERTHARELERSQTLLATTENHLGQQVQRLQGQLLALERERNLMMAILKQEGLLHHLRSARGEPIQLDTKDTRGSTQTEATESTSTNVHFGQTDADERETDSIPVRDQGETGESQPDRRDGESGEEGETLVTSETGPESVARVLQDLQVLTATIFDDDEENIDLDDTGYTKTPSPR